MLFLYFLWLSLRLVYSVFFWCLKDCVADVSCPFPGGEIEQASEQAGKRRSAPVVNKKCERRVGLFLIFRIRSQFRSHCLLLWKRLLPRLVFLLLTPLTKIVPSGLYLSTKTDELEYTNAATGFMNIVSWEKTQISWVNHHATNRYSANKLST